VFLQELKRLAARPEVAAAFTAEAYERRRVRYIVKLDHHGGLLGLVDLAEGSRPPGNRGREMSIPSRGMSRTSGISPLLLADGPDYVFGIRGKSGNDKRTSQCHQAFLDLLRECAQATGLPEVRAVERYLTSESPPKDLDPNADIITFEVGGVRLVELTAIQQFWVRYLYPPAGGSRQCLICGRTGQIASVWPIPIKGIPGKQTAGYQLASANLEAFESYGLLRSQTSPACLDCVTAAGKALNWLLARDDHHLRTPTSVFVFWTKQAGTFDLTRLFSEPRPEDVQELLSAAQRGRLGALSIDEDRFFLAELGSSGSRVVLRAWLTSTLGEIRSHLAAYFRAQAIVGPDGSPPRPIPVNTLALATARGWEDVHPEAVHDLVMGALTGVPFPPRLLAAALGRARAEQKLKVTRPRAALLMMTLSHSAPNKEVFMTQLDDGNTDPAYVCGRLLAELAAAQRAALGNPNTTLTDRYFGAASSSPATVFGPLLRNAQHHLTKLRKDKPGVFAAIDGRITDIVAKLDRYPTTLSLKEQAIFALGYYHQRAADRAAARAAKARGKTELAELVEEDTETTEERTKE